MLAYHLIWTTYGTWLPGDQRGWVKHGTWEVQPPNPAIEHQARSRMAEEPVLLTPEQRALVATTIQDHSHIRGWKLLALNVRSNHVHAVVSADRPPEEVRNQFGRNRSPSASESEAGAVVGAVSG
jgi:hypothetical protein